jgi:uncharacterized membrane protein YdjX (TVP38/TMEM64 family)
METWLRRLAPVLAFGVFAALLTAAYWSWQADGLVGVLVDGSRTNAAKVDYLREWFARLGAFAPLAYVAAVTIEVVVAPLPGLALYAPGGLVFGGFLGGLLALIGNVLGAMLAFGIARTLGAPAAQRYFARADLVPLQERLLRRGGWVVFALRVNPLTSSDLVSYAAGLTTMPLRSLVAGTTAGMAPLCFAQAYAAAGLVEAFPWLIQPLLALGVLYVLGAILWLRSLATAGRRADP